MKKYVFHFICLFLIEVFIALYVHDDFIRPYFGDFLAVFTLYYLIRSLSNATKNITLLITFFVSFGLEYFQYLHILDQLKLTHIQWLRIVMGNYFAWEDLLAYAAGLIVLTLLPDISKVKGTITQQIWSDPDTVLLIFAGASVEFVYSEHLHWLFYTGKLTANPFARMISTLAYAQKLLFAKDKEQRIMAEHLRKIHDQIGEKRGITFPESGFYEILAMLYRQSIKAYELNHRPLSQLEKDLLKKDFEKIGTGMSLQNFERGWEQKLNYTKTVYSDQLIHAYQQKLPSFHFRVLLVCHQMLFETNVSGKLRTMSAILLKMLLKAKSVIVPIPFLYLMLPKSVSKAYASQFQ